MNKKPRRFLILHNSQGERSEAVAQEISVCLRTLHGMTSECITSSEAEGGLPLDNVDFLVAVGGDGNMLRVGRLGGRCGCPVLGVNLGRVGFLPQAELDDWPELAGRVAEALKTRAVSAV